MWEEVWRKLQRMASVLIGPYVVDGYGEGAVTVVNYGVHM